MRSAASLLHGLLALAICIPPYAILFGMHEGRVLFTLYREPKLAAFQILGWLFLLLLIWLERPPITRGAIRASLRQPLVLATICFTAYGAVTFFWALVPANLFYELNQYLFLSVFLIALHGWGSRDPAVSRIILFSLALSLVPLVYVGIAQSVIDLPFLRSIDPGYGVRHASFMGYKNPMALSLLGHFFLLLYVTWNSFRRHRRRLACWALAATCVAELAYLVSLQSRSVYLSLLASGAALGGIFLIRSRRLKHLVIVLAVAVLVGLLFWILLVSNPAAKARFESLTAYLEDPSSLLESDRGTYLRNTLNMVRHNPFGVGLGEWQTHYPVYRSVNRELAYTAGHQARRAHSDHVQFLGELGAPGLALWLALLAAALVRPLRHYLKTGRHLSLFLTVQIFACVVVMAADYLVETPYNKFQFFLTCGLAMIACRPLERDGPAGDGPESSRPAPSPVRSPTAALLLVAFSAVAVANIWYYSRQLTRNYYSSMLTTWYVTAIDELNAGRSARATETLERVERYGERFRRLPGHSKTFYKDLLALAHASSLRGRDLRAIELTRESLLLHPYHPNAFGLLRSLLEQGAPPQTAMRAEAIRRYIMDEASTGFLEPYPAFLLPASAAPGPFDDGDTGARRPGEQWRGILAGRTLTAASGAPTDRGIGTGSLSFCSDGRFYAQARDAGGRRIELGWWTIRADGEAALLELRSVLGASRVLSLSGTETTLRVDGAAAEISTDDEVCE
ncbi:MAG: O-antigen ligase family protein [bacterium]|nr:O-antigen ligase family protein [bacterium]